MLRSGLKLKETVEGCELTFLFGLLIVTAGAWGLIELAAHALAADAQVFDDWMLRMMRTAGNAQKPIGPPWMPGVARDITALGSWTVLLLLLAAVACFLYLDRRRAAMRFVLAAILSGFALNTLLKLAFARERPEVVAHLTPVQSASFPSGHAMMSAVAFLTLGTLLSRLASERRLKYCVLALAVVLTGLIGASRVYLGVHYPTDVLAGWTAGVLWSTLWWLVVVTLQRRGRIEERF